MNNKTILLIDDITTLSNREIIQCAKLIKDKLIYSLLILDNSHYNKMVSDSLAEDFSWIQKGKQGPVFDYLDAIGIDRNTLPEVK